MDPTDRAEAHYRLALALTEAGERDEARRQVLRALEIAPGYEAALELLLRIRGSTGQELGGDVSGMLETARRRNP